MPEAADNRLAVECHSHWFPVHDDVDHIAVWGTNEEPPYSPRLRGEGMNDLQPALPRFLVRRVDIIDSHRDHGVVR